MKTTTITIAFIAVISFLSFSNTLNAQNEFRISQPIPDSISKLEINEGWHVVIKQDDHSDITIVTPCSVFYDEANEPRICDIDGKKLTLVENTVMPKGTTVEITLQRRIQRLYVNENADVQTGILLFHNGKVSIHNNSNVKGLSWKDDKEMDITVFHGASLTLDSMCATEKLSVYRGPDATLKCPALISNSTLVRSDRRSLGSLYQSDSSKNITVKVENRKWLENFNELTISGGISAPIPLYINNTQGSAYNRGENYRLNMLMSFMSPIPVVGRVTFKPWFIYDFNWSRLLNSVVYDGDGLVLSAPTSGELPQQHLLAESFGIRFQFNYSFGKLNSGTGKRPYGINFGINALKNTNSTLITRTMGSDNRWHREREKVNILNPWQIQAFMGINGGPLTRASIGLTYDLLPTFRSGTDADKIHTFGITLSF